MTATPPAAAASRSAPAPGSTPEAAPATQSLGRKARILLVDDHPIVRQGLALMLSAEPDFEVCGQGKDVCEALEMITKTSPDLVVADLSLSGLSGLDLVKEIKAKHSALPS